MFDGMKFVCVMLVSNVAELLCQHRAVQEARRSAFHPHWSLLQAPMCSQLPLHHAVSPYLSGLPAGLCGLG